MRLRFPNTHKGRVMGLMLIMCLFLINFTAAFNFTDGSLVAYYPFNETTGTVRDVSMTGADGLVGNAFDFSNGDKYVDTGILFGENIEGVSLWFKHEGGGTHRLAGHWISGTTTREINLANGDISISRYTVATGGDTLGSTGTNYSDGQWHHLVYNEDASGAEAWIDGVSIGSEATDKNWGTPTKNLWIGASSRPAYGDVIIDEFAVFNDIIDSSLRSSLRNSGNGKSYSNLTAGEKTNLVSYYSLDEVGSDPLDSHGSNDGTLSGGTISPDNLDRGATGIIEQAIDFDGSTTYVDIGGEDVDTWTEFSWGTWVKLDSIGTQQSIIIRDEDASFGTRNLFLKTDGTIQCNVGDGTTTKSVTSGTLSTGQWYYVVCTAKESDFVRLYINGTEVGSASAITNFGNPKTDAWIGSYRGTANYFDGIIDEPAIWDRALNSTEISELYNSGAGLAYSIEDTIPIPTVTLTSPANNGAVAIAGHNFTAGFDLTGSNPNNYTWDNYTQTIWYNNGTIFNQTTVDLSPLNSTNSTLEVFNLPDLTYMYWGITAYAVDDSSNVITTTTSNNTFFTYITINILDSDNNIPSGSFNINCPSIGLDIDTSNPYVTGLSNFLSNSTATNVTCTFSDNDLYHSPNTTTIEFSPSNSVYNVSLISKYIQLDFYHLNGSAGTVAGWYSNSTTSVENFTNSTFIRILKDLYQGDIFVRWVFNNTLANYTQFFDFNNDWITQRTQNLTILDEGDVQFYVKVVDESNNPIEDALVRTYIADYAGSNNYGLIGQRFTTANGYTNFFTDDGTVATLLVTANGYTAETINPNDFSLDVHTTEATAFPITLKRDGFEVTDWTTLTIRQRFDALLDTQINFFIYSPSSSSVQYTTSYAESNGQTNRSISLSNDNNGLGTISLANNDWAYNTTNDITLTIYLDNEYWRTITIENINGRDYDKFNEPSGLDSEVKAFLYWLALIITVYLLGLFFNGGDETEGLGDYGKTLFFIGIAILTLIDLSTFKYLLYVLSAWLGLLIVKQWIKE